MSCRRLPSLPDLVGCALVALLLTACTPPSRCTSDGQCDTTGDGSRRCDVDRGQCLCVDDRGCSEGESCNSAGSCQARGGCTTNDECGDGLFCDVTTSACLALEVCGSEATCCSVDAQCPFGTVCDTIAHACVQGCRDDADCLLGQGCSGAGLGALGSCGTACTTDSLCGFGQLCNLATGSCVDDTRGPYCFGCSGGVQSDDCGTRGNFCLLDTVNGGAYCGVDCGLEQACPFGYECRDVIILPQSTLPTCALPEACVDGTCSRTGAACTDDESCPEGPPGSNCPRADVGNCELDATVSCSVDAECPDLGACVLQECREREGAAIGVCTCTRDTDCPRDRCLGADVATSSLGNCELSGRQCLEDFECDVITCVDGGCLIGRNCKPGSDRTCADLLD